MAALIYLTQLLLISANSVFGKEAKTVTIPGQGIIVGREISMLRVYKITGYFGIPYAQPPTGQLRFADPNTDSLPSWEGIKNNTFYPKACLQSQKSYGEADTIFYNLIAGQNHSFETDEDCLYLNIFVPYGNAPEKGYASILWFHPGNFSIGAPNMWNPHPLVYKHHVIIITFSWRMNIMGFFTTMDGEAAGNYGLKDQQAAMIWVKKNIELFGGDPNNICIMGYGSGGESIGLHMINRQSRELFNRAIIMSSNFLSQTSRYTRQNKQILDLLSESFGCNRNPTSQLLACLRNADPNQLIERTLHVYWGPSVDVGFSNQTPAFLPDIPKSFFEKGDFHEIPVLTGYTSMEEILNVKRIDLEFINTTNDHLQDVFLQTLFEEDNTKNTTDSCSYNYEYVNDAVHFFYGPINNLNSEELRTLIIDSTTERTYAAPTYLQASYVSRKQPTYLYRSDRRPVTSWVTEHLPDWLTLPHLFDLLYIWGVPYWSEFPVNSWHLRDKRHSDILMAFWTNFAKTGNPTNNVESNYAIKWDAFTEQNPRILIIDDFFNMSNNENVNYKAFEFWNHYYPKTTEMAARCCGALNRCSLANKTSNAFLISILIFINPFNLNLITYFYQNQL